MVVYDCHSIRSHVPRLFDGALPVFNIGTNDGATCDPALAEAVVAACEGQSHVLNGRFKGGWTTRHYGAPARGIHAIQMELAMRAYLDEPDALTEANWPPVYDPTRAAPARAQLAQILAAATLFATGEA